VPAAKPAVGIKVTAMLFTEYEPATAGEILNDVAVTDTELMLLLKVITTGEAMGTPVAPLAGVVANTMGEDVNNDIRELLLLLLLEPQPAVSPATKKKSPKEIILFTLFISNHHNMVNISTIDAITTSSLEYN
jgi:hypothetical protein